MLRLRLEGSSQRGVALEDGSLLEVGGDEVCCPSLLECTDLTTTTQIFPCLPKLDWHTELRLGIKLGTIQMIMRVASNDNNIETSTLLEGDGEYGVISGAGLRSGRAATVLAMSTSALVAAFVDPCYACMDISRVLSLDGAEVHRQCCYMVRIRFKPSLPCSRRLSAMASSVWRNGVGPDPGEKRYITLILSMATSML